MDPHSTAARGGRTGSRTGVGGRRGDRTRRATTVRNSTASVGHARTERGGAITTDRTPPPSPGKAEPVLSVVVVTYNEAECVGACLESVLAACREGPAFEVILVDSNSTDATVDVAREYPVTILQIPSDDLTTPGAGRFVGTDVARGEYLLFVDGDMELTAGWLERALAVLDAHDDVAGVDGHLNDSDAVDVEPAEMLHGVALYDAGALEEVAGFDPFLRSLEDIELGYRLSAAGYRLLRLPTVVADHDWDTGVRSVARRWRAGYYVGFGQVVRKSCTSPRLLRKFLARYRYPLLFNCWLALGLATAATAWAGGATALLAWTLLTVGGIAGDVAWEGAVPTSRRITEYVLIPVGFVRGVLLPRRDGSEFPVESVRTVERPARIRDGRPERPAPADADVARADGATPAGPADASPARPTDGSLAQSSDVDGA